MLGTKIFKNQMEKYTELAIWANANNARIVDKGGYYEVVSSKVIKTEEEIQKELINAVQEYMDSKVQTRNYDSIFTACSYANSTDTIFAKEAKACIEWRDNVWRTCYNILAEYKQGKRKIPTREELIKELPVLAW